jgi:large subunit ribosomal protein L18
MATGPNYRVPFRRRREGKTDYRLRRALVLSELPRLVIRGSLRNIVAQLIKAEVDGDKVIVSAYSSELTKKYGWQADCSNLPAAYLTGLLCGYKAVGQSFKEAVLDIGLQHPSKGSRIFAALKGFLDAGVSVPYDEEKSPSKERIEGQHIVEYAKQLSSNPDLYQKRFSEQLSKGLRPEELSRHFVQTKEKIVSSFEKAELPKKREGIEETEEET